MKRNQDNILQTWGWKRLRGTHGLLSVQPTRLKCLVILASLEPSCGGGVALRFVLLPERGENLLEGGFESLLVKVLVWNVLVFVPIGPKVANDALLHCCIDGGLLRRSRPHEAHGLSRSGDDTLKRAGGEVLAVLELHHLPYVDT